MEVDRVAAGSLEVVAGNLEVVAGSPEVVADNLEEVDAALEDNRPLEGVGHTDQDGSMVAEDNSFAVEGAVEGAAGHMGSKLDSSPVVVPAQGMAAVQVAAAQVAAVQGVQVAELAVEWVVGGVPVVAVSELAHLFDQNDTVALEPRRLVVGWQSSFASPSINHPFQSSWQK